jgi:hypothetical protein
MLGVNPCGQGRNENAIRQINLDLGIQASFLNPEFDSEIFWANEQFSLTLA